MKKLLLLFIAFNLATSCSSDENSPSEQKDSTLPKTISYLYPSPMLGTNTKETITYDGVKIVSILGKESKKTFTYNGDLIIKQEQFDIGSGKENKSSEVSYEYENGKLKTRILKEGISVDYPNGQYINKAVYTHTSNEVISYISYNIDKTTNIERKNGEGTLTYKNGNLVKHERKIDSYTVTSIFEYDSKKNPLKNIIGVNLLLNEFDQYGNNNIVKTTQKSSEFPNPSVYLTTYVYNNSDYPTKHTSFDGGGKDIEYEVEYTY